MKATQRCQDGCTIVFDPPTFLNPTDAAVVEKPCRDCGHTVRYRFRPGLNVVVADESLAPDQAELRDADGKVLCRIENIGQFAT